MVRSVCLAIALLAITSAAWADNQFRPRGSTEDSACRGDARRFCREDIPDQFRVASCLQVHRDSISRACRSVLEGHGM
jgi:hypothetical protein